MTEEVKSYRIAKVASELGVGVQTIAEELNKRGFDVDAKPTSKLNDEMYMVLLKVFKSDKEAREEAIQLEKNKKDLVDVAKGAKPAKENTENEDEEDVVIINNPTLVLPTEKPAVEIKPEPPVAEPPAIVAEKKKEPPVEEPAPEKVTPVAPITEHKVTLAGPKIVNKINLDDLSGKGRKDKDIPKAEEKPIEQPKPIEVPAAKVEPEVKEVVPEVKEEVKPVVVEEKKPEPKPEPVPEPKVVTPEPTPVAETVIETKEPEPEVVATKEPETPAAPETPVTSETPVEQPVADVPKDNIIRPKMEKLQGLTVLGKIKLPVDEPKKKPVASSDPNEKTKKKRKRKVSTVISSDNPNIAKQFNREKEKEKRDGTGPKLPTTPTTSGGSGGGDNRRGRFDRNEPREISQKEIQDKLKQTMAKLNPGSKGPGNNSSQRYKNRRTKRDQHAQNREDAMMEMEAEKNILRVTEFVTANELAKLMNISVNQVITTCFSLGMMVSINQRLDAETITIVADEFGFDVQFVGADLQDTIEEEEDKPEDLVSRPPIVTVMGHVDHGKTSLLDYIRDANIVAGEAGGITQHIGAYEVTLKDGRQITFLDTPGHEAFTAMRARGAKLTDIAIIVIAADDSVMPQTKEAISHSQAANVPMVFAFNKMDRDGANADKVREQLSAMNILVEEWGGKHQTQEISAKKGLNIDLLLDKVLLESEILDLKANPNKRAKGTVIEARMDKGRGIVATLMVQEGTLKIGDPLVAGAIFGRIKAMFNERGQKVEVAGPSVPVSVLGFTSTPQAGENFNVMATEAEAKDITTKRTQLLREQGLRTKKHITLDEIGRRLAIGNFKELNVIVKADVDGSAEALADSLLKLSTPEVQVNVIHKGVGQISESDVLLATASDAIVVGFQVRPSAQAKRLAENEDIEIKLYSIIYSVIDEIKAAIEGLLEPKMEEKIICNVEVREVFKISKVGTIAGCMVTDGKIHRNTHIRIIRDGVVVHTGSIDTLKRYKDDVKEVATGYECGISIKNFNDIREGDNIEGFEEVEVKRKL
jgi:translation initiation factor IF-2